MAEYRIIKRAGLYVVQRKMAKWLPDGPSSDLVWRDELFVDNPHENLGYARRSLQRAVARDSSQPYEVIE